MEKFFKIGDIAKLYGIGADSVRYYEELNIISPRRDANGYRMYSINDIWRLNVIRDLRALGFSMERIKEYLCNRSVDSTIRLLEEELASIHERLEYFGKLETNVMERLRIIRVAQDKHVGVVTRERFEERRCYEIQEGYATDEEMDVIIQKLLKLDPSRHFIIGNNRIGSRIAIDSVRRGRYREYAAVFIIADNGMSSSPAGSTFPFPIGAIAIRTPFICRCFWNTRSGTGWNSPEPFWNSSSSTFTRHPTWTNIQLNYR